MDSSEDSEIDIPEPSKAGLVELKDLLAEAERKIKAVETSCSSSSAPEASEKRQPAAVR
jgi:hypothetical protein